MNASAVIIGLAALCGVAMALQAPTNAIIAKPLGSSVWAALVSFVVGLAALAALALAERTRPGFAAVRGLPWYAWTGGLYGAFVVVASAYAAPRIGVGALSVAVVAGQLTAAVLLDHLGALGLERHPASPLRLVGLALVVGGAVLVRRG